MFLLSSLPRSPVFRRTLIADTMDVAGSQTEAGQVRDEVAERTQKRFQVRVGCRAGQVYYGLLNKALIDFLTPGLS